MASRGGCCNFPQGQPTTAASVITMSISDNCVCCLRSMVDLAVRTTWVDDGSDDVSGTFSGSTIQINATPPLGTSGPRVGFAHYNFRFLSA